MATLTAPSTRRREIELEDLAGLAAREAIDRVRALELRPAVEACEVAEVAQRGVVLTHDPAASAIVHRGQLVTLLVGQHAHAPQPPPTQKKPAPEALVEHAGGDGDAQVALDAHVSVGRVNPIVERVDRDAGRDSGGPRTRAAAQPEPAAELPASTPAEGLQASAPTVARRLARTVMGARERSGRVAAWALVAVVIVAVAVSFAFAGDPGEHRWTHAEAPARIAPLTTTAAAIAAAAAMPPVAPGTRHRPRVRHRARPLASVGRTRPASASPITHPVTSTSTATAIAAPATPATTAATTVATRRASVMSTSAAAVVSLPPSPIGPLSAPPPNQTTQGGQP